MSNLKVEFFHDYNIFPFIVCVRKIKMIIKKHITIKGGYGESFNNLLLFYYFYFCKSKMNCIKKGMEKELKIK